MLLVFFVVIWDCIDVAEIFGVDVWIVFVLLAGRIVLDVQKLTVVVVGVSYAVFVITGVPDFSCFCLSCGEGVSAFDVLNALCC